MMKVRVTFNRESMLAHLALIEGSAPTFRTLLSSFEHGPSRGQGEGAFVRVEHALEVVKLFKRHNIAVSATKEVQAAVKLHAIDCKHPKLFDYQVDGATFLATRKRALLADEMGTGKTIQSLISMSHDRGTLVVCPSVMVGTWESEARKWRPDLTTRVWRLPWSIFPAPGELNIVSYPQLPFEDIELQGDFKKPVYTGAASGTKLPKTLFDLYCDEAHYLKSSKTQRSRVVRALADRADSVKLLTGTPVLNRPPELWALLQAMKWGGRDVFGSWENFCRLFGAEYETFYRSTGPTTVIKDWSDEPNEEAKRRLSCIMLRRTRADVLPELPKKTYRDITIDVKPKDSQEVPRVDSMLRGMSDDAVLEACGEVSMLAQIRSWLAAAKIATMVELIEEYEQQEVPLVVFSYHRAPIDRLAQRKGWRVITGATSDRDRTASVKEFQEGKLKGIAGTIGAMGVGVTLTHACNMLFVDQSYVPAENLQAEDREVRIGQKNAVLITRLIARHPIDARVTEILDKKMSLLEGIGLQ